MSPIFKILICQSLLFPNVFILKLKTVFYFILFYFNLISLRFQSYQHLNKDIEYLMNIKLITKTSMIAEKKEEIII